MFCVSKHGGLFNGLMRFHMGKTIGLMVYWFNGLMVYWFHGLMGFHMGKPIGLMV